MAATKGIDYDDPEIRPLLGTMPDAELAAQLGVDRTTVRGARVRRGIEPFMRTKRNIPWDEHLDAVRTAGGDLELVEQLGVSRATAHRARVRLATITPDEIRAQLKANRDERRSPWTAKDLATDIGMAASTLAQYMNGGRKIGRRLNAAILRELEGQTIPADVRRRRIVAGLDRGPLSCREIALALYVSRRIVLSDLKFLAQEGLVERQGTGQRAVWSRASGGEADT